MPLMKTVKQLSYLSGPLIVAIPALWAGKSLDENLATDYIQRPVAG